MTAPGTKCLDNLDALLDTVFAPEQCDDVRGDTFAATGRIASRLNVPRPAPTPTPADTRWLRWARLAHAWRMIRNDWPDTNQENNR